MGYPKTSFWKQAPFLQLIIPLIAGIACALFLPAKHLLYPIVIYASILIIALTSVIILVFHQFRHRNYHNSLILVLVFMLGMLLTFLNDESLKSNFAGNYLKDSSYIALSLQEPLVEKPRSWKAEAKIMWVDNQHHIRNVSGSAILYFEKTDSLLPLQYGDVVLIPNRLAPISNSGNPGAFDYKRYCHFQNIYYQAFLPSGDWRKLPYKQGHFFKSIFIQCRTWCLHTLSTYITHEKEAGVAEALLLGYRDNLDESLRQAYANAGVVHIIAISGLHLGLIYLILLWLLSWIPDKGKNGRIKGLLIILCLWCFVFITGAAPSALRAAVMLSFITIGKFFIRRYVDVFNTFAASAFLLLCYDPFLLFNVGFQLSYLAVAGILIFQKPIYHLWISTNKIWNYVWKMMSLTLAAQCLVFPLVMFYFHRFPLLFLLSNLLIVPLSSLILYGEITLLAVSVFAPVARLTGYILTAAIATMDNIIVWINSFSFSLLKHISFTLPEVIFLYIFITGIAFWLFHKNKKAIIIALAGVLCFSISKMISELNVLQQKKIIIYNISNHTAIDFIEGRDVHFIGDTMLRYNVKLLKYNLQPARNKLRIQLKDELAHCFVSGPYIRFFKKRILLLNDSVYQDKITGFFPVDFVIISGKQPIDLQQIHAHFSPKCIIFDSSVPFWKIEKWKTACKQLNLPCFSVPDQGAWILSLR